MRVNAKPGRKTTEQDGVVKSIRRQIDQKTKARGFFLRDGVRKMFM